MSTETLQEMENRWALLMAATYSEGRFKGERVSNRDPKYARETTALRVQIEERRAAEIARPQISAQQLAQLEQLDVIQNARDKQGKPLGMEMSERGSRFRQNLHTARQHVLEGRDITQTLAKTESTLKEQGGTLPTLMPRPKSATDHLGNLTGDARLMPNEMQSSRGPQPINTQRSEVK